MLSEVKTLAAVADERREPVLLAPVDPLTAFDHLVQAAYDALTANFGQAERFDERIDFEATFMTKSYLDEEITIAAWANRADRKPTSMQQRASNPKVYERTVTADVYHADRPGMQIVEDTSASESGYAELYAGQKQRIKSSVVYPVLSSEYELLGTLVLHCDHPCFFAWRDEKFWRTFCEVFATRLALAKLQLDESMHPTGDEKLGAENWDRPPF
jgi:GAF domain-containing protein